MSARDLAILARALIREFPEYDDYWHLHSIRFGRRVIHNCNKLLDLYPGADGMKTGFICASGFNLVATATRNGRRLIAVVLGAPSASVRKGKKGGRGHWSRSQALLLYNIHKTLLNLLSAMGLRVTSDHSYLKT